MTNPKRSPKDASAVAGAAIAPNSRHRLVARAIDDEVLNGGRLRGAPLREGLGRQLRKNVGLASYVQPNELTMEHGMQLELDLEALKHARRGREDADDYGKVIAIIGQKWRVIECAGRIQWISRDGA